LVVASVNLKGQSLKQVNKMNKENNFEIKSINLEEMNEIIKIKDDEMKTLTGGYSTSHRPQIDGPCNWHHAN
jgi:natural product precursor